MPDTERMTVNERRKCLKRMQGRYLAADRAERAVRRQEVARQPHPKRLAHEAPLHRITVNGPYGISFGSKGSRGSLARQSIKTTS